MVFRIKASKTDCERSVSVSRKKEWANRRPLEPEPAGIETVRKLIDAARHEKHPWDRAVALKKLGRNVAALTEIANDHDGLGYDDTRKLATRKLSRMVKTLKSPAALICVACNSTNKGSRMAALEKLGGNEIALREIVKYGRYEDVLDAAVKMLSDMVHKLNDPESLRFVAFYSEDQKKRQLASKKLERQDINFVIDVAKHNPDPAKRKSALNKLYGNVEALREVARCGYYFDTAKEAIDKLAKLAEELSDPLILDGLPKLL